MEYKVGDKVIIKSWEQMEKEYGHTHTGDIDTPCWFVTGMRPLCGKTMTIGEVSDSGRYYKMDGDSGWCFCKEMILGRAPDTVKGLDGTVYVQDPDKQGWTAYDPIEENDPPKHDPVNHPSHYCREGGMESIDEMVVVFGREAVMNFCLCNVWKYRYRAADKNGDEDLRKSDWYMRKYRELKESA